MAIARRALTQASEPVRIASDAGSRTGDVGVTQDTEGEGRENAVLFSLDRPLRSKLND